MRNIVINNREEGLATVKRLNENSEVNVYQSEYNGELYSSKSLYVLVGAKTIYALTKTNVTRKGDFVRKSIVVRKMTNNPYGAFGKNFDSFEEAAAAYKSPEIKLGLLKLEMDIS